MSDIISSIKIENFQAHKELSLDFSRAITTITGPSDRGKSAIIRALIWVITNRPNGDGFIRYGADECHVTVKIGTHTIERIKGRKRNLYILDGVEFKALKTDVPEEVQKIFNVNPNNIQGQFDSIFWFSETAGEVGRNLNQIVNLDVIDYVLGEIQSKTRQTKTEMDVLDSMVEEQKKIIEDAKQIEAIQEIIDRIHNFQENLIEINNRIQNLGTILSEIQKLSGWLKRAENYEESYRQLEIAMNQYIDTQDSLAALKSLITNIDRFSSIILQSQIPESLFSLIVKIEEKLVDLTNLRKQWKALNLLLEDIGDVQTDIVKQEKDAKIFEKELHQILDNNVCPLCGRGSSK